MEETSFFPVSRVPKSSRAFPSPLSRFMAAFFVLLSALRYSSTSFFSVVVRVSVFDEEDAEEVFF
jgi:hypothetical protein